MNTCYRNKSEVWVAIAQSLLLALGLAWLAGCKSASYAKGDAAANSINRAASEVQAENRALDEAMNSLDDLVNKPSGDLKPQLRRFSDALDRLVASAKRTQSTGEYMAQRNAAYFDAWHKRLATMNYEVIRTRSEARLGEVTNHFAGIQQRYQEAQTAVEPLIYYLQDIRTALSSDLNGSGLDAVKPIVANAGQNAEKVKSALVDLSAKLTASGTEMASFTTPAQALSQTGRAEAKAAGTQ